MKRLSYTIVLVIFLLNQMALAQKSSDWCATEAVMDRYIQNSSESRESYFQKLNDFNDYVKKFNPEKSKTTFIIPTVVHVIHNNGLGNISDEQVLDGIAQINEDFKRLNSDTTDTRSIFKPFAGAMDIEFRLAKKDPNGNCTNGIKRVNSVTTNGFGGSDVLLSKWDNQNNPGQNQYFNIWIVNSIANFTGGQGIILGYAYYPGGTNSNGQFSNASDNNPFYGMVNINSAWGRIGNILYPGRTPTHEVGHALGLPHTFNGSCGSDCSTSGDYVCDTPPARDPTYGCNITLNTCANDNNGSSPFSGDVVNQIENYMSYDDCQNMFSQGQVNRMTAALNFYSKLQTLTSTTNLVATGTNDSYYFNAPVCAPIADFWVDKRINCQGNEFTFESFSYNAFNDSNWTYQWSFPGGTPSTSTLANPSVNYSQAGDYNVSLIVSNSQGSSAAEVKNNYVSIINGSGNFIAPKKVFFTEANFPNYPTDSSLSWDIINQNNTPFTWERNTNAFFSPPASIYLKNFNIPGNRDANILISPVTDLTQVSNAYLNFQVAYAQRNDEIELLMVYYSSDCGNSWKLIRPIPSPLLYTRYGIANSEFIPGGPNDWKLFSLDISNLAGLDNITFKLEFRSHGGNNIYIDDFEITESEVSALDKSGFEINELKIYPNPSNGNLSIEIQRAIKEQNERFTIINSLGQIVETFDLNENQTKKELNLSHLESGLYFIQSSEYHFEMKKIIIE